MADKPEEKTEKKDEGKNIWVFLGGLVIVMYVFNRLVQIFNYYFGPGRSDESADTLLSGGSLWVIVLLVFLASVAIIGLVVTGIKLRALDRDEEAALGEKEKKNPAIIAKNEKWDRIMKHINSDNPAEWRLAIIEADVMLDDLLSASGYHGDTIGEKLKAVEASDFLTIEAAWEAHKIRNRIAHSGADFDLTEREAKRIITLYESVFREFGMI